MKEEGICNDKGRVGNFTFWSPDGKGGPEMIFYNGDPWDGEWHEWYENGQKEREQTWKEGKRIGKWDEWYENGQKDSESTYKDGKRFGKATKWHENGQKAIEQIFKDGKRHGKETRWHENGKKEFEGTWENNVGVGEWKEWHEDGSKKKEGTWEENKLDEESKYRVGLILLRGLDPENPNNIQLPSISQSRVLSEREAEDYSKEINTYLLAVPGFGYQNPIWLWRPLWEYLCLKCDDILSKKDIQAGRDNSEYSINKTTAKKISSRLNKLHKEGDIKEHEEIYTLYLESLPDEECQICEGTGIRNDELGKQQRAKDPSYTCNGCKGKGSKDNFFKLYPFHVDNVLAFGEFCAQSGGFQIL